MKPYFYCFPSNNTANLIKLWENMPSRKSAIFWNSIDNKQLKNQQCQVKFCTLAHLSNTHHRYKKKKKLKIKLKLKIKIKMKIKMKYNLEFATHFWVVWERTSVAVILETKLDIFCITPNKRLIEKDSTKTQTA